MGNILTVEHVAHRAGGNEPMEDVLGAGEDGAIDDMEACGQLDLAPSCRGHQRHRIRPPLHRAVGCVQRHRRVLTSPVQ